MDIFIDKLFDKYYQRHPIKLIDIGASGGPQYNWKKAKKNLQYIGFEPDNRSFCELKKDIHAKEIYINKALHKDKGTIDFYLTKQKTASSVFVPNKNFIQQFPEEERYKISEVLKLEVASLDSQLKEHGISDPDFMKLDTQGSELFILEGATNALSNVFGLEIEVEFNQIYEKQPLFADVDKFVRNLGFQLFDLKPYYWKRKTGKRYGGLKGQIIFADALYFLDLEHIGKRLTDIRDNAFKKAKLLRLISTVFLYGYIDYATALFEQEKTLFSEEEIEIFYSVIKKEMRLATKIPHFPGKGRMAKLFKILHNVFRYHHRGWATAQEFLGNLE